VTLAVIIENRGEMMKRKITGKLTPTTATTVENRILERAGVTLVTVNARGAPRSAHADYVRLADRTISPPAAMT
jgi:hypothetical protein